MKENDKRIYTMEKEKPIKAVLKMGIPVTLGMLVMVLYNLVDTFFIGQLNDPYQLAASNFAYPVMMISVAMAGFVGNGAASYIARCIGGKKIDEANHTLTIGFELTIILSILLTILGLVFINPIVTMLGAKDLTFNFTKDYVVVMFIGSLFIMGNYAFGQLLRSEGSTFYSMIGMIVGTVANIILDPIFIFTFDMQIKGAAIATVIANGIGMLICLYFYAAGKTILSPSMKLLNMDKKIIGEIMAIGIPHTLEQFLAAAAILVSNNLAVQYGELTVGVMGVANKIMSIGTYIYQGMAAGCQPLMGFNYGAKNYDRLKKLIKSGFIVIVSIEIVVMIYFGIRANALIDYFTDDNEVILIGAKTLRAVMLMLPFVGITSLIRNVYNSIGKPLYAFGITIVRQLILYIPIMIIFDKMWGYTGLIFGQPCEELICMIFAVILLFTSLNRFEKKEKNA
ncbi:MAG: MATE family efflux transporter [Clostridia bacterium]|nr:MATE family efflux transporter [Clostridia bacterium]